MLTRFKSEFAKKIDHAGLSGRLAIWFALLVFIPAGSANAAGALDKWRSDAAQTRALAENDAPRAYEQAQRLRAALPADATPADQVLALNLLGRTEAYLALTGQSAAHTRRAMDLALQYGDRVGQAQADLNTALTAVDQANIDGLIAATTHSMAVLDGMNRPDLLSEALLRTAMMYRRIGQIYDSVTMSMQGLEIARRSKDPLALTYAHQGLAISFEQSDRYEEARDHYVQMREQARAAHSKLLEAYALVSLGNVITKLGDSRQAESLKREAITLFREVSAPFGLSFGVFGLADHLRQQARYAEAQVLFDEVIALYKQYPHKIGLWYTLNARSSNYLSLGKHEAARTDAEQAYALAKDIGLPLYITESTRRMATFASDRGDYRQAYRLSVEATDIETKAARANAGARMVELAQRYESESKQREINELTRRNQQQTAELRQRLLQQRWLWTVIGGGLIAFIGAVYFLLRLRRSQNDLQNQTRILQSVLDSMGDGVSVANERGELILVNPAAEKLLGTGAIPGNADNWTQHYGLYLTDQTTPYPVVVLPLVRAIRGECCDNIEMFVRNPMLSAGRWLSVTARPLTDNGGVTRGGVAVFSDITARKHAVEEIRSLNVSLEQRVQARTSELRQQARYLRTLIDMLPMLAWFKDTESRYLVANQASAEACGHTVTEMIGKSDLELWPREIAESCRADDREVMATRQRKTIEEMLSDVHGAIWIETYKAAVLDEDGTLLGTVGAARDISAYKAAAAAREAALAEAERLARLRSEFMAQMSHELRTPLNGILGYAQILGRDQTLSEQQVIGLNVIRQSGEHLLALINDILDFAKIEAGKLDLNLCDIALDRFLRTIADIINVEAEHKHLRFILETSPNLPEAIRCDDKRLRQVLLNLLANSVKFTDHGQVSLHVGFEPPGRLRFEVRDTGIGIEKHQLEMIFQPFEQAGQAHRQLQGTGLGLAISRRFVRLMGSDIQVESEIGKGSTFWFELESAPLDAGLTTAPSELPPADLAAGSETPGQLLTPPTHEMEILHRLARLGNMKDILQRANYLAELDQCYLPLADQLRLLAKDYQSQAILSLVEQHLQQRQTVQTVQTADD